MRKGIVNITNESNDVVACLLVDESVLETSFEKLNIEEGELLSDYLERLPFEYEELKSKTLYLNGTN